MHLDVTVVVDVLVLSKNACDREEHRRFAFIRTKEGHLVTDVRQYAIKRSSST